MEENIETVEKIITQLHRCKQCELDKPKSEFHPSKGHIAGVTYICKPCYNDNYKAKKAKQREDPKWHEEERRKDREYRKRHHGENPEAYENRKAYNRKYRLENLDEMKKYKKQWDSENQEKRSELNKKWRDENREYYREYRRDWEREERKNNPQLKIRKNLRVRLNHVLKTSGGVKAASITKMFGCSLAYLVSHIEKQWLPGMSWENYGKNDSDITWEIDHIKSLSQFDLTIPKNQFKANHYTNLRPLWAKDNRSKAVQDRKLSIHNESNSIKKKISKISQITTIQ